MKDSTIQVICLGLIAAVCVAASVAIARDVKKAVNALNPSVETTEKSE